MADAVAPFKGGNAARQTHRIDVPYGTRNWSIPADSMFRTEQGIGEHPYRFGVPYGTRNWRASLPIRCSVRNKELESVLADSVFHTEQGTGERPCRFGVPYGIRNWRASLPIRCSVRNKELESVLPIRRSVPYETGLGSICGL